jgi:Ca-activated chloride channel family protein
MLNEIQDLLDSGNFEIAHTWVLWLALLPVLVILLPPIRHKTEALFTPSFKTVLDLKGEQPAHGVQISKRNIISMLFLWVIWLCLVVAASSPQIVGEPQKQIKTARNFLLNIDLSLSMETRDWINSEGRQVSRWDAVKEVMDEFITRRKGDRMGLILFGSQAYLQTPFTDDLDVVRTLLNESEVGMAGAKTAIGNSIGKSVELFERDSIQKKVMVLVTDGDDSGSELKPIQAARLAATDSITIYTIGIGTKGQQTYELDDYTLTEIARATNGQYFEAADRDQLEDVYTTLDALEPIEYESNNFIPKRLLFYYPLMLALIIAILYHGILGLIALVKIINLKFTQDG